MKAAVYRGRGSVRIEEAPRPPAPDDDEVTVRVVRAAICGTDASEWAHGPNLCAPPVVLGHEFVGEVVAAGSAVELSVGDRVVSGAGVSCRTCSWCRAGRTNLCRRYYTLGLQVDGGLAELVNSPAAICRALPPGLPDDDAVLAQPLAVALHAVGRGRVGPTHTVAVIGVGGVGALVVAATAARGVSKLVAVDVDESRLAAARALGATTTANVSERDIAAAIIDVTDGEGADVVFEASGAPVAPAAALAGARRGGRVVLVGLQAAPRELDLVSATVREVEIVTSVAHVCDVDLPEALELLAAGGLAGLRIERTIALDDLVAEGLRPLAEGRARGKIVVAIHR